MNLAISRGPLAALGVHLVEERLYDWTGRFLSSYARLGVARIQARCDCPSRSPDRNYIILVN